MMVTHGASVLAASAHASESSSSSSSTSSSSSSSSSSLSSSASSSRRGSNEELASPNVAWRVILESCRKLSWLGDDMTDDSNMRTRVLTVRTMKAAQQHAARAPRDPCSESFLRTTEQRLAALNSCDDESSTQRESEVLGCSRPNTAVTNNTTTDPDLGHVVEDLDEISLASDDDDTHRSSNTTACKQEPYNNNLVWIQLGTTRMDPHGPACRITAV